MPGDDLANLVICASFVSFKSYLSPRLKFKNLETLISIPGHRQTTSLNVSGAVSSGL